MPNETRETPVGTVTIESAEEVARFRETAVKLSSVNVIRLIDSHEALRAHVSALAQCREERDEARRFGERAAAIANQQIVTCAFCGAEYPTGTPRHGDGALAAHVRVCEQHPMRAVEAEADRLRTVIEEHRAWLSERVRDPFYEGDDTLKAALVDLADRLEAK